MTKQGWVLPIKTEEMKAEDLVTRVKFAANNMVRYFTFDSRDIIFRLNRDKERTVNYLSEVHVDNVFNVEGQKFGS